MEDDKEDIAGVKPEDETDRFIEAVDMDEDTPGSSDEISVPDFLKGNFKLFDDDEDAKGFTALREEVDGICHNDRDEWTFDEILDVGQIKPELVDEEQNYINEVKIAEEKAFEKLKTLRAAETANVEHNFRNEILTEIDSIDDAVHRMKAQTREYELQAREGIHRKWQQHEDSLVASLQKNNGTLQKFSGSSVEIASKKWIAEWNHTPQPYVLSIHSVQGTKDRLPCGDYILHVEILDGLSGSPLSYVSQPIDECKGNTRPHHYRGKYYSLNLAFNERFRMVCPSDKLLQSHIVLQFEIWRLKKGKFCPVDTNLGWGVWPLVGPTFNIGYGNFKIPILKGAVDPAIDTFTKLQNTIENDLSNWLGNLYITIAPDTERALKPANELSLAPKPAQSFCRNSSNPMLRRKSLQESATSTPMPLMPPPPPLTLSYDGSQAATNPLLDVSDTQGGLRRGVSIKLPTSPVERERPQSSNLFGDHSEVGSVHSLPRSPSILKPRRQRVGDDDDMCSEHSTPESVSLGVPRPPSILKPRLENRTPESVSLGVPRPPSILKPRRQRVGDDDDDLCSEHSTPESVSLGVPRPPSILKPRRRGNNDESTRLVVKARAYVDEEDSVTSHSELTPEPGLPSKDVKKRAIDSLAFTLHDQPQQQAVNFSYNMTVSDVNPDREVSIEVPDADRTLSIVPTEPLPPPGPDRKVDVNPNAYNKVGDELMMLGVPMLPKVSFFTDLAPAEARSLEKDETSVGEIASGPRREKIEKMHFMQLVGKKNKDWEELDMIAEEAETPLNNDALDAGEIIVHDERVTEGMGAVETLQMTPAKLATFAGKLPVLKKIQNAQEEHHTDVDLTDFKSAISNRREFFRVRRRFREKLPYVASVLLYDMGVNPSGRWHKTKLMTMVLMFLVTLLLRSFAHSFGLWVFLTARDVPIIISWMPYRMVLDFDDGADSSFSPLYETLAVASGMMFCIGVQILMLAWSVAIQLIFGFFPLILSRFVFCFCLNTVLDPLFTSLMDTAEQRWRHGEAFLLYHMFKREEGSGLPGIAVTLVIYTQLILISGFLWYKFTTAWHLNGKINDVYKRLESPESSLFMPYDMEISQREFDGVVHGAQRWRSESGDTKKIVCENAHDMEICLFRERLWVLLQLSSEECGADPQVWLQKYLNRITLSRPKRSKLRSKLGSQKIGSDILKHLQKYYPFLMQTDDYLRDDEQDGYHDLEYEEIRSTTSIKEADLREQKHLLLRYWEPQVKNYPVRVVEHADEDEVDEDSMVFKVLDAQLLADLIFFEKSGALSRSIALRKYLGWGFKEAKPLKIPGFNLRSRHLSCAINPVEAAFVTIFIQRPTDGARKIYRSFIYLPNGALIEAIPSGYTFDPGMHTTDFPEYWIHRNLARHAVD